MNPQIIMCNYYGMCDQYGDSVGHTVKVTNEYSDLLKEKYAVELDASPCIVRKIDTSHFVKVRALKYDIQIDNNSIIKRILDKLKLLFNISQIVREKNIYFFYQVDFFFFFYMCFLYRVKKNRRIICLVYHQDFMGGKLGGVLKRIYRKALKKIDGVIYTQIDNPIEHKDNIWIPDFFYNENQYAKYQKLDKKKRVVCVGTMNRFKQLEELVEVFTKINISLLIVGRFDETERYERLVAKKSDNIEIQNRNLSNEEYLETIATSKYSILPYNMFQYQNRTSGVLLESIYVGSIPIAPIKLLEQNRLPGLGYNSLNDLLEKEYWVSEIDTFKYKEIYSLSNKERFIDFIGSFIER